MSVRSIVLKTPPLPLLVDASIFDGFAWTPSTTLEWRCPEPGLEVNMLDAELPLRMAFVFRTLWSELPHELARLHVGRRYGLQDEWALAPYAIDDATDGLWLHRRIPNEMFWLAADNLNALFWGLHDWVHFHNHGPFDDPTATEAQCDTTALAWLYLNRNAIGLSLTECVSLQSQVSAVHRARMDRQPSTTSLHGATKLLSSVDALRECLVGLGWEGLEA